MRRGWGALGLAALMGSGCAHAPAFVRNTPVLRLAYRPKIPPRQVVQERFACAMSPKWQGPEAIPGGVQFSEPEGHALISIAFHSEGSRDWKPPDVYRRYMREEGYVEDSHVLQTIEIATHTASSARFTTYEYDKQYLLGEKVEVRYTELVLVPDRDGIYLIRYEAAKQDFSKYLLIYEDFLRSLVLTAGKKSG